MNLYCKRLKAVREAYLTASIRVRCGDESYRDYRDWTAKVYRQLKQHASVEAVSKDSESTKKPATAATVTSLVSAI